MRGSILPSSQGFSDRAAVLVFQLPDRPTRWFRTASFASAFVKRLSVRLDRRALHGPSRSTSTMRPRRSFAWKCMACLAARSPASLRLETCALLRRIETDWPGSLGELGLLLPKTGGLG